MVSAAQGTNGSDPGNVVPYADQALFLALRGAGQEAVMQALWIYEHPVDMDGLRRFHRNLGHGLLARRIERSPLPFGRLRWVAAPPTDSNFTVAQEPRDRAEFYDWADAQVNLPLDPEWGPAWRMSVQPLTDGATAVSLVISHCIADGGASVIATIDAVNGTERDLGLPRAHSRTRSRAMKEDLRRLRIDLPEIARTVRRAATVARNRRKDLSRPSAPRTPRGPGDSAPVVVPSASVFIDGELWDARAAALAGNSFSLVAGFAGRLAFNLGRTRTSDGQVTLMIPVSVRESLEDTGGNVVSIANAAFDPGKVTTDLTGPRTAVREGIKKARETTDEMVELLPLIPFVPRRAFGRLADAAFGFSTDLPVSCSNFGDVPSELTLADGTPAEYLAFRGVDRQVSRASLERRHGLLTVASARISGKFVLSVISYQVGGENTQSALREVISRTLGEFGLDGTVL